MLQVHAFTFNPFQENTYILFNDEKNCWIIDPGMYGEAEEQVVFDFIAQHELQPQHIINTHAHIDHVLGIAALQKKYAIPFGMHADEVPVLANAAGSALMFGLNLDKSPVADFFIKEGSTIKLGEDALHIRLAPGHSPGSIVFYYPEGEWIIGGDVLFQGSIGRSDLPGGNHEVLLQSISSQLYTLPDATTVYSGHGAVTNIGIEKQSNPFIRG